MYGKINFHGITKESLELRAFSYYKDISLSALDGKEPSYGIHTVEEKPSK